MEWSKDQQRAIDRVQRWLKRPHQPWFYLAGYAGTGKSTLARHLADSAGEVRYAAFTGKAAHVMRMKGCTGATTIHSLIYQARVKGQGQLEALMQRRERLVTELVANGATEEQVHQHAQYVQLTQEIQKENDSISQPSFTLNVDSSIREADLVVIDECSMVNEDMGEDLLSFNVPVLVLGDPGQLPPVGGSGYFTGADPDALLTQIHRQARENPIIDLATRVREGERLEIGEYGTSEVMDWADVEPEMAMEADQVLVGTNRLRRATNRRMRELFYRGDGGPYPVAGDKLVCLRNDHDVGLLNGSLWRATETSECYEDRLSLSVDPLDGIGSPLQDIVAHAAYFRGEKPQYYDVKSAQSFDMGYALTVHKAQGSQWNDVLVFDESGSFRQDAAKWLYTAITRAAQSVKVVMK